MPTIFCCSHYSNHACRTLLYFFFSWIFMTKVIQDSSHFVHSYFLSPKESIVAIKAQQWHLTDFWLIRDFNYQIFSSLPALIFVQSLFAIFMNNTVKDTSDRMLYTCCDNLIQFSPILPVSPGYYLYINMLLFFCFLLLASNTFHVPGIWPKPLLPAPPHFSWFWMPIGILGKHWAHLFLCSVLHPSHFNWELQNRKLPISLL